MDLFQKIRALPGPVQEYLYGEELLRANGQVIEKNSLDFEKQKAFLLLLQRVVAREVTLSDLEKESAALLENDGEKAKALARDIAGHCLLPLDRWLGDVSDVIRRLGGDPDAFPAFRVQIIERSRDEAADEVITAASTEAVTVRLRSRMQDAVESFLAGVRTEEQTRGVLVKPEKTGGVGLDEAMAKRIIDQAKAEARSVVISSRPAGGEIPSTPAPGAPTVSQAAPPIPEKKKDDFVTIRQEDEEEIERVKKDILPAKGVDQADEIARRIEASIEEIYLASGLKNDDEVMTKRAKTVIANRLRDVRDQMETLEIMVQPKELGGLGLSQDAARALLNAIQAKLRQVHDEHAVQAVTEKTEWVEKEKQQKIEGVAREEQENQTDLERLYSSIVSKSKKATLNAPTSLPPAAVAPPSPPVNLPIATTNPVPPELRAPAVVPLPAPPAPAPAPAPAAPPLTIVRPMPGVAVMPQVQGTADAPRPRMDDVKPMARVTGPVEELRAITIVDFRRLSKDPTESCAKIKNKIDVLAEQSYTRRTEAIAAWGASEVVRTYLELMGEGLNGISLKDAVVARQAAKKPYLTPEEFQAIGALSRQLRY